jgi:molecular chaperone GrpE
MSGIMTDIEQETDKQTNEPTNEPIRQPAAETGEPSTGPTVAELQEQLAQAQDQATEYLDNWRRSAAELSNARKRMQREMDEHRAGAATRILEKLLPVVDDVDRAFIVVPPDQENAEWVNGFRMIQRKLQGLLESEGVTSIPAEGQPFDPAIHYAVTHEEADGFEDGQIIAELARGYLLNDKVLRPAMVRVAKG